MNIERFAFSAGQLVSAWLAAHGAGANRWNGTNQFLLIGTLFWISLFSPRAAAGDYRLQVAARPEDFPPDPQATQRSYLHHQINNSGDILFSAHWRDFNGFRRSGIYAGPPGDLRAVVEGGDSVRGFPNVSLAGGPDQASQGNFPQVTFNAQGEVWFTAFVLDTDPAPGTSAPFSQGFWKASGGKEELVGADPGFEDNFSFPFNVNSVPYSGFGRLQWTGFRGFSMTDSGDVFFSGDIKAYKRNVGLEFVLDSGLIIYEGQTNQMYVITYPRAPVPGSNDWVFSSINLYHVGHKNGALVLDTTLEGTRTNVNLGERKRVFYHRIGTILEPIYTEKDPLPDLPPLSEVLGTDEPFDLLSTLLAADGTGNFIFAASASARNRIGGAPMGIWKWDRRANKLVKLFRFQEPLPTPAGPVRLDTNIAIRAKMGNNKAVFVAGFTGLGYTSPTTGLFQENGTNFTLLAATGMVVPGTNSNFVLGPNIGSGLVSSDFYANESNEVLFAASFRTNTTGPASQGMFAWRDGTLQSVIRAGQQMSVGGTNRTIRAFGYSALQRVFNDLGMFMAIATFTDGTSAILRASPEAGDAPCCESGSGVGPQRHPVLHDARPSAPPVECDLFTFTGKIAGNNWHGTEVDPPTNWNDGRGQPHCDPPGDALPGEAVARIDGFDVVLDQRSTDIGSLHARGALTLQEQLRLNQTSVLDRVTMAPPRGRLTANAPVSITNVLHWSAGLIDGLGSVQAKDVFLTNQLGVSELLSHLTVINKLDFDQGQTLKIGGNLVNLGQFRAGSGLITNALLGAPTITNFGTIRKDRPGEFTIGVPFHIRPPLAPNTSVTTEVLAGILRLAGGGTIQGNHTFYAASGATLELSGEYQLNGTAYFGTNGVVHFGRSDRPIVLEASSGSAVFFRVQGNTAHFNRGELRGQGSFVNEGDFVWSGGAITLRGGGSFENLGDLLIERGVEERKLSGEFRHRSGTLSQIADLDLSGNGVMFREGVIFSYGAWSIDAACRIIGTNGVITLDTDSELKVQPILGGLVEIEGNLLNRGSILVGGLTTLPETTLRLKDVHINVVSGRLYSGVWRIEPGALLETPGRDVERVIGGFTEVSYGGRGWPQFRPTYNEGTINVSTNLLLREMMNKGHIHIMPRGDLEIQGDFIQDGQGSFRQEDKEDKDGLVCEGGRLRVRGDLINRTGTSANRGAVLNLDGQLINTHAATFFVGLLAENPAEVNISDSIINQGRIRIGDNSTLRTGSEFINDAGLEQAESTYLYVVRKAQVVVQSKFSNRAFVTVGEDSLLRVAGDMETTEGAYKISHISVEDRGELHVQGNLTLEGNGSALIITNYGFVSVDGLLINRFGSVRLDLGTLQVGELFFTRDSTLFGTGVIDGDTSASGTTSPGTSPGTLSILGNFIQTNTSALVVEVAGTATNRFDRLLVSQTASIGGTLALNLLDGFRPAPSDTFIVLQAGRLTNQFANATNGQRIATFGGFGSFQVNYTPTNVVLSAFQANPNPPPTSPGRLFSPTFGFNTVELKLTGSPGRDYILQTSTNLLNWLSLLTNNASFDGQLRFELPATTDLYRFFRARNK